MRYVAFLRAVNVGKHNRVKMADLKAIFEGLGFKGVSTYIQSGNVLFDSPAAPSDELAERIEEGLLKLGLGHITTVVRSASDLESVVRICPFGEAVPGERLGDVTFLRSHRKGTLPDQSPKGDVIVHHFTGSEVYSRALDTPSGRGDITKLIDKELKVQGTARNWNVVQAIQKLLEA